MSKKYPGYNKCFVDVETTGTDRDKHHIWQLSGSIVNNEDKILETFDFKFKPYSVGEVDLEALSHCNITTEELESFTMTSVEAFNSFQSVLGRHCNKFDKQDKYQMIAYNAGFDSDFLRLFWKVNNDNFFGSWFWTPPVCIMQMAAAFLIDVRGSLPNFKLGTLCEAAGLGWDSKKAHDSSYDIAQTIALYRYLRENSYKLGE